MTNFLYIILILFYFFKLLILVRSFRLVKFFNIMGFKTCFMICSKVFIKVFFVIKIDQIFFFMFELIMLFLYLVLYLNLEFLFINCFTNFIKFNLTDLHAPSLIQKLMHSSIQQLFFIINSKYHHQSINLILFQFHRNFH